MSFSVGGVLGRFELSCLGADGVEKTGLVPERRGLECLAMLVSIFQ